MPASLRRRLPRPTSLQGLRERNWTSKWYNPAAEKWDLKFFEDRWGGAAAVCCVPLQPAGREYS
jgi:hypothetical protein